MSLIAVKQSWIQKSIKVSLIPVKNIIVVTYCSKSHQLSLSLIAVNEIPLITQPYKRSFHTQLFEPLELHQDLGDLSPFALTG